MHRAALGCRRAGVHERAYDGMPEDDLLALEPDEARRLCLGERIGQLELEPFGDPADSRRIRLGGRQQQARTSRRRELGDAARERARQALVRRRRRGRQAQAAARPGSSSRTSGFPAAAWSSRSSSAGADRGAAPAQELPRVVHAQRLELDAGKRLERRRQT